AALIVMIEASEDPKHCGLAAARRADKDADLSLLESECDVAEHVVAFAGRVRVSLARNIDLKPHGAATWIAGLRTAAPGRSRSRIPPRRSSANKQAGEECRTAGKPRQSRSRHHSAGPDIRPPGRSSRSARGPIARRPRYRERV